MPSVKQEVAEDGWLARVRSAVVAAGGQTSVAAATGLPYRSLNSYLTGAIEPKFKHVITIASACRVSLDWLAYGQEPGAPVDIDIPLLLEIGAAVEAALAEAGRELPPLKRLEVAAHHYCDVISAGRTADPAAIRRLVRLVA